MASEIETLREVTHAYLGNGSAESCVLMYARLRQPTGLTFRILFSRNYSDLGIGSYLHNEPLVAYLQELIC
jgi:hypothetical protein